MENFDGIFVCSTNLMESLDPASLRRFDFKVRFDYLTNEQRLKLFHQQLQKMGHEPFKNSNLQAVIDKLASLTPGDFAVARKQFAVLGKKPTPEEFANSLVEECKAKPGVGKTMGFI
jgi:SpoVK/Ycf46/Vps4 family AAA+-type ATPase